MIMTEPPIETALLNWTSLFLLVSSLGFFLAILLVLDRKTRNQNWPISLIIFGFSLIMIQYVFYWSDLRNTFPFVYFFHTSWYFLFGPLLYFYVGNNFYGPGTVKPYHFIIPILLFSGSFWYFIPTTGFTEFESVREQPVFRLFWSMRSPWAAGYCLLIYYFLNRDLIKRIRKELNGKAAQFTTSKWIHYINQFYFWFVLAYFSYYILSLFPFFKPAWDYAISIVMCIGIYSLGIIAYKQPQIFNGELLRSIFLQIDNKEQDLTTDQFRQLHQKLLNHMEEKRPYLDNELRLVSLADQIGISTHLLSQLINTYSQKNFNQFINSFRLNEAKELLVNTDQPIKSIYFSTGFSNKVTFNKWFKQEFGCTPTIYREQNRELYTPISKGL